MIQSKGPALTAGMMAAMLMGGVPQRRPVAWDRAAPEATPKPPKKRNKAAAARDRIQRMSRKRNRRKR